MVSVQSALLQVRRAAPGRRNPSARVQRCDCGNVINRDHNAAVNLFR
ncbi:MAG: transposase [Acetobacteraceae bacterium]|nr:transposase [Acetobacteraceae bacterium]